MAPDVSPVLGHEILDLVAKRTSLMVHLDRLRTLVVGSSHGDFGFDPAYVPEAFNLARRPRTCSTAPCWSRK